MCRGYIDRAFAACEGRQADLEKVQEFLKVQLNDIFRQNRAWDVDWDSKPLPLSVTHSLILIMMILTLSLQWSANFIHITMGHTISHK